MRDYDIIRPAVKLIEKKVKELVQQDQMAMFVSTGQRSGLTFAGDNKITKWFIENYGFEYKQKCAELLRNGENGMFTTSSHQRNDKEKVKNNSALPLLSYHIDDPRFMNTKVIKAMYSKMMAAEGLSRSFGVESKMPKWWVDEKGTDAEKEEERNFWKIQRGCNPPTGVDSTELNWPSTLRKFILRCYLFHLGSLETVREYYEYVNLDVGHAEVAEAEVEPVAADEEEEDPEKGADQQGHVREEEVSYSPGYLPGLFSWGKFSPLPETKKPVVLQFRACMGDGGQDNKVLLK